MNNEELIERLQRIESMLERMHSEPRKPFLKTKDACDLLSVCPNTLVKICIANGINPKELKGSGSNYYRTRDFLNLFN